MSAGPDWGNLAPPLELPPGQELPPDERPPEDGPACPVCGEVIIREPSWKRMHKYHDECAAKVAKGKASGNAAGGSGYPRKVEQEADECERILKAAFVKIALGVSVVDRYDAFCIMVNTPAVCSSFRGVCLRYAGFRKEMLAVKSGGSLLSLIFAGLFMLAPIFAHHGLIPSKSVAEMMVKLPVLLYQLSMRVKEGEEGLTVMMQEYMEQMKAEERKRQAREQQRRNDANGQYVGPSPS